MQYTLCRRLSWVFLTMTIALVGFAESALADTLAVTNVTVSNTGTTADNNSGDSRFRSQLSVTNSGGSVPASVGAMVAAGTRMAFGASSDKDSFNIITEDTSQQFVVSYKVGFDVVASRPMMAYNLAIDTGRLGALLARNDGGSDEAEGDLSAVTGLLNGIGNAALGLADVAGFDHRGDLVRVVNQSNQLLLAGVGSASYMLEFFMSGYTKTTRLGFDGGGDESAILFGISPSDADNQIDNYPRPNGSVPAINDGHFVAIKATITNVPEPSTWVLAVLGGLGMLGLARRRRS